MGKTKFSNKQLTSLVTRRDYSKITKDSEAPNLLDIQKKSFSRFMETNLENTISSFFPSKSIGKKYTLSFHGIEIDKPKCTTTQCREKGKTFGK